MPTRWTDYDVYGHVNNVVCYLNFDTAIDGDLIETGGLDLYAGKVVDLAVRDLPPLPQGLLLPRARGGGPHRRPPRQTVGAPRGRPVRRGQAEAGADGQFVIRRSR